MLHTRREVHVEVRKPEYRRKYHRQVESRRQTDGRTDIHTCEIPLITFVIPIINNAPLGATTDRRIKCINDDNRVAVNAKSKIHRRELLNANEAAINHPAQLLAFDARNDVPALCIAITD